jgi:alkanesulfonate monooxygenase SsuD/methylene tetrahydromethanopterin reductase-like flavin-dependent oxidoreductase (luciferase family)
MDESRARFEEGIDAIRRLLEEENVTFEGRFHSFRNVTSLPRPTRKSTWCSTRWSGPPGWSPR